MTPPDDQTIHFVQIRNSMSEAQELMARPMPSLAELKAAQELFYNVRKSADVLLKYSLDLENYLFITRGSK
jgi:hypothetical protein